MGERWTHVRKSLHEHAPDAIGWLRKQLFELGPFLDPIRNAPPSEQLSVFDDAHDAAIVALL